MSLVKQNRVCCSLLSKYWDFPGGPLAKTPCSQCRGPGFDP